MNNNTYVKGENYMIYLEGDICSELNSEDYYNSLDRPKPEENVFVICYHRDTKRFLISMCNLQSIIITKDSVNYKVKHISDYEYAENGVYVDMSNYPVYKKEGFTHWGHSMMYDETEYVFKSKFEAENFYMLLKKENKLKGY